MPILIASFELILGKERRIRWNRRLGWKRYDEFCRNWKRINSFYISMEGNEKLRGKRKERLWIDRSEERVRLEWREGERVKSPSLPAILSLPLLVPSLKRNELFLSDSFEGRCSLYGWEKPSRDFWESKRMHREGTQEDHKLLSKRLFTKLLNIASGVIGTDRYGEECSFCLIIAGVCAVITDKPSALPRDVWQTDFATLSASF